MTTRFRLLALFLSVMLPSHPGRAAVARPTDEQITRLVRQLGSRKFRQREAAERALEAVGERALDLLDDAAAKDPDPEVRRRAAHVFDVLTGSPVETLGFARSVLEVTARIEEDHVRRIRQGELIVWSVEGLYGQLGERVPAWLARRLRRVEDMNESERLTLLSAARKRLGRRPALEKGRDAELAVGALLGRFDPHAQYWPELPIWGCVVGWLPEGIGVRLETDRVTGLLRVVTPLKRGPAYRAGIRSGDLIRRIAWDVDGDRPSTEARALFTRGQPLAKLEEFLQGRPRTLVHLSVVRGGVKQPLLFHVRRQRSEEETVLGVRRRADDEWDYRLDAQNEIGYVRIAVFGRHTAEDFGSALARLRRQGIKALILDLRFNRGGLLMTAEKLADRFLPNGDTFMAVETRRELDDSTWRTTSRGELLGLPVAVLVNEETTSTGEVIAACLQDHRRAVVVGERTRGKASVQNIVTLGNGEGALKMTTALFLRPSGKKIDRIRMPGRDEDEWGVMPDHGYVVRLSPRERADLLAALSRRELLYPAAARKAEPEFRDRQLERALEALRTRRSG
jgi:C-terminal peptidase prc